MVVSVWSHLPLSPNSENTGVSQIDLTDPIKPIETQHDVIRIARARHSGRASARIVAAGA